MLALVRCFVLLIYFILINALLFVIFILRPMHRDNVYLGGNVYATMARIIGVKLVYRPSVNVDPDESYVVVANHQNSFDLMTVCKGAIKGVVTVGKKSLKWIPVFGVIYWLSGNIMIDRKNSSKARDTLQQTADKMRERNISIWMFPEGTRFKGNGLLKFKTGAFRLALAEKKSILPVVCSEINNGKIKLNRWNNGTVIVKGMDPIDISGFTDARELADHFHDIMQDCFFEITEEAKQLSDK